MHTSRRIAARNPAVGQPSAPSDPQPIFIHCNSRTLGTWLWKHVRANSAFCAYYEIFREAMAILSMAAAGGVQSPDGAPYFLEHMPVLDPSGGVRNFVAEAAQAANFFPERGLNGPLAAGEERYVAGLIANALEASRIPVLTCTRMLGRSAALKHAFGGIHIVVHQNLFHQWNAISGQHRSGNPYPLEYLFQTIVWSTEDLFMDLLKTFAPNEIDTDLQRAIEARYDDAFAIFVAWHVYMMIHAARPADIIIDVSRFSIEPAYRHEIQDRFRAATGHSLELGEFPPHVDAPWRPIRDPGTTILTARMLVDRAYAALAATVNERALGDAMLEATWSEHRAHTNYAQADIHSAEAMSQGPIGDVAHLSDVVAPELLIHEAVEVEASARDEAAKALIREQIDALVLELAEARRALAEQASAAMAAKDHAAGLLQSAFLREHLASQTLSNLKGSLDDAVRLAAHQEATLRDQSSELVALAEARAAALAQASDDQRALAYLDAAYKILLKQSE